MAKTPSIITEFRDFLMRGNVVELAVAFVAGAAFSTVVKSIVEDIISPLIAVLGGKPNFRSSLILELNGAQIMFGAFLTEVIGFVITMAAVFFVIVKPVSALQARLTPGETDEAPAEPELVTALQQLTIVRDGDGFTFQPREQ